MSNHFAFNWCYSLTLNRGKPVAALGVWRSEGTSGRTEKVLLHASPVRSLEQVEHRAGPTQRPDVVQTQDGGLMMGPRVSQMFTSTSSCKNLRCLKPPTQKVSGRRWCTNRLVLFVLQERKDTKRIQKVSGRRSGHLKPPTHGKGLSSMDYHVHPLNHQLYNRTCMRLKWATKRWVSCLRPPRSACRWKKLGKFQDGPSTSKYIQIPHPKKRCKEFDPFLPPKLLNAIRRVRGWPLPKKPLRNTRRCELPVRPGCVTEAGNPITPCMACLITCRYNIYSYILYNKIQLICTSTFTIIHP